MRLSIELAVLAIAARRRWRREFVAVGAGALRARTRRPGAARAHGDALRARRRDAEAPRLRRARRPAGRWWTGLLLIAAGSRDRWTALGGPLLAHMGQHLLIADLAAPLLLIGLRSPVTPSSSRARCSCRWPIARGCGVPSGPAAAARGDPGLARDPLRLALRVRVRGRARARRRARAPARSFLFGSLLVWWSVIEPKRRRMPRRAVEGALHRGARPPGCSSAWRSS